MNTDPKIATATRYAFAAIALMLAAFAVYACAVLLPVGLSIGTRTAVGRAALYVLVASALAGGIFSIRVAALRKKNGR